MADWVMVALTALSLMGAGFSWWRANASQRARDQSADAAKRAEESLSEVKRQTLALEELASAVRPDPLVLEHETADLWRLRNTTNEEIAVERVLNLQAFAFRPIEMLPVVILPKDAAEVSLVRVWEEPLVYSMELQIRGRADVLRVPIPPQGA